jgi:hypothetical protein
MHAGIVLASGATVVQAASVVKVAPRTIYQWYSTSDFRSYVDNLRSALLDEAVNRLAGNATKAADTLVALLDDMDPSIRLRASLGVVEMLGKMRDRFEIVRRLEALEQARTSSDLAIEARLVEDDDEAEQVPDNAHERLFRKDIDDGQANGQVA